MSRPKIDLKELAARESEQIEWKRQVASVEKVLETITAFANDFQNLGGGYVVCGAEEMKDQHGFQAVAYVGLDASRFKEVEGKVMADARTKIDPPVTPLVEELPAETEGRRVLVFIIPASGHAHSYRSGGDDVSTYYVRIGRETIEARNGVLRELLVRRQALAPWDRRLNEKAALDDIDLLVFRELMQEIDMWNPSTSVEDYFSDSVRISEFVPALGGTRPLDSVTRPRNFALLLFGKSPTSFFPGGFCKFSVYPGHDRGEASAERHELTGSLVSQARKLLDLLKPQVYTAFDKQSPEANAPKYPERALQEAVINALVHRDYESDEPTSVTVFSDRVEIRSPGGLPRTVSGEKFQAGTAAPSWRNQSLAYFFNKLHLAQAEGQGIPTILRTMKQLGSPNPLFEIDNGSVTCVLPAHPRHQMIRHVAEIERLLIQQDYTAADSLLTDLLEKNPGSARLLELYAQVCSLQKRAEKLGEFLLKHGLKAPDMPVPTLYQVADVLLDSSDAAHRQLGNEWLSHVANSRLETGEVKRVALALRKVGNNEKAIQVISRYLSASDHLDSASLFDIRARAKTDLAKKCMETGRNYRLSTEIKRKAWEQCRQYLAEAQQDLIRALEIVDDPREKEFTESALEFVRQMKANAERPPRRRSR